MKIRHPVFALLLLAATPCVAAAAETAAAAAPAARRAVLADAKKMYAGTGIPDWSDYDTVVSEAATIRVYIDIGGPMRQFLATGEPEVVIARIDAGTPR